MGFDEFKKCLFIMLGILALNSPLKYMEAQQVPCYFIFGDSLVDSGNNNNVKSAAKANYVPYGIDFPAGPTGRFSNGKTSVDVIAEQLGFKDFIPAYIYAKGETILKGVNFASAAGGIRNESGLNLGERLSFGVQLKNYEKSVQEMVNILGDEKKTAAHLSKCIYSIYIGNNDYLNNYFMPNVYPTSKQYTPEEYATALIEQYSEQLKTLHKLGARKVALLGVAPTGCTPYAIARTVDGKECNQTYNSANQLFNAKLVSLVDTFNSQLTDAKFTYINVFDMVQDVILHPAEYDFSVVNVGCCGTGRNRGETTCLPKQEPCGNRSAYVFWDAYHPTEKANVLLGTRAYTAKLPSDVHPYDIQHLVKL